jgi:hypothetical protein
VTSEEAPAIRCPGCGQADQVEKVSSLYLWGIGLHQQAATSAKDHNPPDSRKSRLFGETGDFRSLSRRLAPPASSKQVNLRPMHPDQMVLAFSLVLPIFLYGILTNQRGMLLPVAGLLAAGYGFYAWQRGAILARYEQERQRRKASEQRIQRGIQRWMQLYYCGREDGIFIPGENRLVDAEQMMGYLLDESKP